MTIAQDKAVADWESEGGSPGLVAKPGLTEDVKRKADGVPHSVVGLSAFLSLVLAGVLLIMLTTSGGSQIVAAVIGLIAIPVLVWSLNSKARKGRDRVHPSR